MEQIAKASVSEWQIADLLKKLGADEEDHYKLVASVVAPCAAAKACLLERAYAYALMLRLHRHNSAGMVAQACRGLRIPRPQSRSFPGRDVGLCGASDPTARAVFPAAASVTPCENSFANFVTTCNPIPG
jgi:hypothetical protein